jgi:broad-specificity NMP kinase
MTEWLDAEIERLWLAAESELRRLQAVQARGSTADIELMFAERRAARLGAIAPYDAAELDGALAAVGKKLEPLRATIGPQFMRRLGLTSVDIEALLVVAAPSLDPQLADVFSAVRGTAMIRRGVDLALIAQLAGLPRAARTQLIAVLDEERPPIALGLVQVAAAQEVFSSASYRSMQPTLDLLWILSGEASPSPSLGRHAVLERGERSWQGLIVDEDVCAWLERLASRFAARRPNPPWAVLCGACGAGKRTVAARLAAFGGQALLAVSTTGVDKNALVGLVRKARRDAAWLGTTLYVGPLTDEQVEQPALIAELERVQTPLLLGCESDSLRLRTGHPLGEHALPIPAADARIALWKQGLEGARLALGADIDSVARGYKLTPGEILASAREVRALAGDAIVDIGLLRGVLERRLRNELGGIATRLSVHTSYDDVILPPEAIGRVRELVARKRLEDRVYREWGLDEKIRYGKGVIALFSGPPGTGKTLLAGLIARELGFELYQVDLSQVFSRWVGETEKALAKVFDQAERSHAVLLFDEADALFAKRTEVEDSRDRYANVAVNFLLQRLERYSGVAVLTTNKDTYLDEALRRRLSLHLSLEEPEMPERLRLWEKHLPPMVPGASDVDLEALAAEYELTGGTIKNVALRASFLAAAEEVPLSTDQVRRAAILELEDMGHVVQWHTTDAAPAAESVLFDYVEG